MSTFAERLTSAGLSVEALLWERAEATPGAAAILGLERDPLSYARLRAEVEHTRLALRRFGVLRGDRVAMVLPNGPEAALCCFSVACAATAAPLNPAYSAAEFEFFLSDLNPKVLIVGAGLEDAGLESPAARVAAARGIRVVQLAAQTAQPAGVFRLSGEAVATTTRDDEFARAEDVALVLHTSGSTSRPKIVPLTQANLSRSARNIAQSLKLTPRDRCLNIMPLFHIHGLMGCVLSSWSAGAEVVCTPGFQAPLFFDWLAEFDPTWYSAVPTMHQAILARASHARDGMRRSRLRFIRSSSSALPAKVWEETERAFAVPMVEAYGMTEASHQMAVNPLPPGERKAGSVGRATGCEIVILDNSGQTLPANTEGNIAIRGASVTAGYENNPEANRACYVNGWFLTGDLGRLDHDGYLFLTGRSKEIINRGGEKIAPREIDDVLLEHPAVAAALTFAMPDERLGEEVAAVVVLKRDVLASELDLRAHAAARLADFKVPRRILFLDELPKGPTGKPQRIGLAKRLDLSAMPPPIAPQERDYVAPRTETECALAAIFQQVLACEPVGIHDDFFSIGGDSILGAQVAARLRQEYRVVLPMFHLFASPTVAALAEWLELAQRDPAANEGTLPTVPRDGPIPLSFAQQRMWFLTQFEDISPAYIIPNALRLRGALRAELLVAAIQSVVDRHEVLRTTFAICDGLPVASIAAKAQLNVPVLECPAIPEDERDAMARRLAVVEAQPTLDLSRDLSIRARLVRFAADDHVLLITLHHIASDGWSKSVLFREIEEFYGASLAGREPVLPALAIQYADYAQWQHRQVESELGAKLLAYWTDRMAGVTDLLELPTDRPRPVHQSFDGGLQRMTLGAELTAALRQLSQRESVTLYMTLLAAFQTQLARYANVDDVCVGTPLAHRQRPETEALIGSFVTTLVMRTRLDGDPTFRELLGRVRETALGAFDHQDLPLEKLIEAVHPARSLSYSPLFQVLFQLRNFPEIVARLEGLEVAAIAFDHGTAQFDLALEATEIDEGLYCVLNYNSALFDAGTARRMLGHFATLLESIVADPDARLSELPLLTGAERLELSRGRNPDATEYPRVAAGRLFEEQAARTPSAVAARDHEREWSYAQLDSHADAVAQQLRRAGVKPGDLVAIYADRSVEMLGGLLGIWKSGAAYVPLDPAYPHERLAYILENSGAAALLTDERLRERFAAAGIATVLLEDCREPGRSPGRPTEASAGDLAYVLYTSGSTGQPKGVAVRHGAVTNLLLAMQRRLDFSARETLLAITTISFDISVLELFLPLISGARVVLASREDAAEGGRLARLIESSGATLMQATPASWQMLFEAGWRKAGLKMICGGEALAKTLADRLAALGRAWNAYGPTETTVYSTIAELRAGAALVPIGAPLDNTQVYVLDRHRQPLPSFVPGELYIGGDGVAAGYWRRPDLTAERFVPDPFSGNGARMYRTGDLVRWLPNGQLDYLRRIDTQVKVRGFRIELGEIESVLRSHPEVRAAAAKVIDPGQLNARLAVFYTTASGGAVPDEELRAHLRAKLPDYMTPGILVALAELPLTPNGKVDRAALCVPDAPATAAASAPPRDMLETALLAIWQQVLHTGPIGIHDDFFALGGHSLLGARMLARIERAFGVKLKLSSFFEAPSVAQMAALLRNARGVSGSRVFPIRAGDDRPPFYLLHADPVFRPLTLAMPEGLAVAGVSLPDATGCETFEQIAALEAAVLMESQAEGRFAIGGWCVDGALALEIAQQIRARRGLAPLVVMFDSFNPARLRRAGEWEAMAMKSSALGHQLVYHGARLLRAGLRGAPAYLRERWQWWHRRRNLIRAPKRDETPVSPTHLAARRYEPKTYDGPVLFFRAEDRPGGAYRDAAHGWRELLPQLQVVDVPGDHQAMFREPGASVIAQRIAEKMAET